MASLALLPEVKLQAGPQSKQIEKRLRYLWQAAHELLPQSPVLSNQLMCSFMMIAKAGKVTLPAVVLDYMCAHCGALLVPGISAAVRVNSASSHARVNRKLVRKQQHQLDRTQRSSVDVLKNTLHIQCSQCGHSNVQAGASRPRQATQRNSIKRTASDILGKKEDEKPLKRPKTAVLSDTCSTSQQNAATATATGSAVQSIFAPPQSPPRKLLDLASKKKKKKKATPTAAASNAKSSLNSFLASLRPSTDK